MTATPRYRVTDLVAFTEALFVHHGLEADKAAVVAPLLTEKIAQAKRKKGAGKLVGNAVLGWYTRKRYKDQKKAAEVAQHRIRTMKARREYLKWSLVKVRMT